MFLFCFFLLWRSLVFLLLLFFFCRTSGWTHVFVLFLVLVGPREKLHGKGSSFDAPGAGGGLLGVGRVLQDNSERAQKMSLGESSCVDRLWSVYCGGVAAGYAYHCSNWEPPGWHAAGDGRRRLRRTGSSQRCLARGLWCNDYKVAQHGRQNCAGHCTLGTDFQMRFLRQQLLPWSVINPRLGLADKSGRQRVGNCCRPRFAYHIQPAAVYWCRRSGARTHVTRANLGSAVMDSMAKTMSRSHIIAADVLGGSEQDSSAFGEVLPDRFC